MITKIQRQNVQALVRQKYKPLLDIIDSYQGGKDVAASLEAWQGYGTTGEAIQEYLETNVEQNKPKRTRKTAKDVNNG